MAQTVNIPFFQMRSVNVPLINGTFRDKDGKMTLCYFQIDTGSQLSIIVTASVHHPKSVRFPENVSFPIYD